MINPGDFLFIQNLYPDPKKPHFPGQIAGNHGAGIITKPGKNVSLKPETLVAFSYYNTWAEYAAVPAEWLIPLPADYPIEKAAQFVNLVTSWDLLDASRVQPGQWLALTAGNSTTATMVLQFAALRNVKVISMIRRAQNQIDLEAWGASEVIELASLAQSVGDRIMEITQGQGVNGILDCVGGPVAGELIRSLSVGGQFVIYGGFSSEKFALHNFDILMRGSAIKSYIYRYFFTPPQREDAKLLREIAEISGQSELRVRSVGYTP